MGRARRRNPALSSGSGLRLRLSWDLVLAVVFALGSAWSVVVVIVEPAILGSHAVVYSEAARAWLTGGDPWSVGPPNVVFSGPPPMLLPFVPTAFAPGELGRYGWVVLDAIVTIWALRRLGLPGYWLAFPPLFEAIVLGHPEVLVLGLLALGAGTASPVRRALAGLALLVKPYAVFPLLAERRIAAIVVGGIAGAVTLLFLPWGQFLAELPMISANLARQNSGDSTFGQPLLMVIAITALAALGPRRALWLVVPVLWPYAQQIYKVMSMPVLPPLLALAWALPIPGFTLLGIVTLAVLTLVERRRPLPAWLSAGIRPLSPAFSPRPVDGPRILASGVGSRAGAGAA